MIVLLVGGPMHDKMMSVHDDHPWLTDDGELRMPMPHEPGQFAIYRLVEDAGDPTERALQVMPTSHKLGAYKFHRMWTRPEEVTLVTASTT